MLMYYIKYLLLTFKQKKDKSCGEEELNGDRGQNTDLRVVSPVNEEERVAAHQRNLFIELDDSEDVKHTEKKENDDTKQEDENQVERANFVHNANNLFDPFKHKP